MFDNAAVLAISYLAILLGLNVKALISVHRALRNRRSMARLISAAQRSSIASNSTPS
jgi:hypothetical protein